MLFSFLRVLFQYDDCLTGISFSCSLSLFFSIIYLRFMNFAASLFCQCLRLVVHIWLFSTILWWSWVWNLNCTFWISGYHLNVALNYESHLKIENIINHRSWNCTIFGAPFQIHLYLSSMVSHSIYISLHKTHSTNNLQYAHLNRDAYKYTQFWYENRMTNRLADWLCEYERIRHDTTHTHKKK